jgi:hypothetical protein
VGPEGVRESLLTGMTRHRNRPSTKNHPFQGRTSPEVKNTAAAPETKNTWTSSAMEVAP